MLVSLSALSIGASPFQVGILAALFAAFPLLLAVYAGKVSDRIGVKRPSKDCRSCKCNPVLANGISSHYRKVRAIVARQFPQRDISENPLVFILESSRASLTNGKPCPWDQPAPKPWNDDAITNVGASHDE